MMFSLFQISSHYASAISARHMLRFDDFHYATPLRYATLMMFADMRHVMLFRALRYAAYVMPLLR